MLTGGLGAVGETLAANLVETAVTQLALRAGTGAIAGVTAKAVDEVKACSTTDKKWNEFGRTMDENGNTSVLGTVGSWFSSAVVGALGGKSSLSNPNLKPIDSTIVCF